MTTIGNIGIGVKFQSNISWITLGSTTAVTILLLIIPTDKGIPIEESEVVMNKLARTLQIYKRTISTNSSLKKIITITNNDEFLAKVMNSKNPVIVNFHAEWCEPCHILTPKMKELIEPRTDVDLAIIDVEHNPELVHTFEVKAVPAVLAVKDGLVIDKFIGLVDANLIDTLIKKLDEKK
ncbi:unnamed protein product [Phyllotreta striolata]|uniref:Thioredoxin domain-containing protein n=1 Tax=Phyllotreta striolata TaxID=444603 RepID=A0A9N9XTR1_PHYSR|nr:unnamed protein product [Phyllotreta striolata]